MSLGQLCLGSVRKERASEFDMGSWTRAFTSALLRVLLYMQVVLCGV